MSLLAGSAVDEASRLRFPRGTADRVVEGLFPTASKYRDDPVRWLDEELKVEHWSMQDAILRSVAENRYTAVHSCHGIGKSWTAAQAVAWWLGSRPIGDAFVVTTAPTWRQVQSILWREIRRSHNKADLPGRTTLDAQWYLGGSGRPGDPSEELVAMGRKPSDYDPDGFQGIHALYVLVIIDEACGVPKILFDAVDSLATNDYARVLAIGNPDDPSAHFAKVCAPGSGWNTLHVSYEMTPNFTGEKVSERLSQLLISPTWVEERKQRWGESSPTYVSKVLGLWPDVSDDTLFSPRLLREAQERELPGRVRGRYGADIARMGKDETVVYRNRGGVIRHIYSAHKQDTSATTGAFAAILRERAKGRVPMTVDSVGVGAGVYDNLREQRFQVSGFNGGESPLDKKRFLNKRAEAFWNFRESLEAGEIDLPEPGEDDELLAQLGAIKWKLTSKGKVQVESKDQMASRGLPSPDRADAAIYSTVEGAVTYVPQPSERSDENLLEKEM